mmetsp:Transcript_31953/g.66682  ORF Transcript_31953/g.66682 Transcript_31953/m.66682 type:complete len:86 (+) Transcript_31953:989-1246(+)
MAGAVDHNCKFGWLIRQERLVDLRRNRFSKFPINCKVDAFRRHRQDALGNTARALSLLYGQVDKTSVDVENLSIRRVVLTQAKDP